MNRIDTAMRMRTSTTVYVQERVPMHPALLVGDKSLVALTEVLKSMENIGWLPLL